MAGRQILPLINHLARLGHRAAPPVASGRLRPRHLIAIKLLGDRGPMTQHAIARALSLNPSNVVGLLNELEERALVERHPDPADRRRNIVFLSPVGEGELARGESHLRGVEADLLKALTSGERATLYDLLVRAVGSALQEPWAGNPDLEE
jgi:DNA-binding MarR family transcriptional regulator